MVQKDDAFLKETEALHNLRALEEIEKDPNISQRELSRRLGVALGITNSLLKTLVRKGLVKIRGDNNRTITYHLTHAGVLAKSRLAVRWTLNTIDFYRQARRSVAGKLAALAEEGVRTVVLYGPGELTEIAIAVAPEIGLTIVGVVDGQAGDGRTILGCPAIAVENLSELEIDAVIVCGEGDGVLKDLGRHLDARTKLAKLF